MSRRQKNKPMVAPAMLFVVGLGLLPISTQAASHMRCSLLFTAPSDLTASGSSTTSFMKMPSNQWQLTPKSDLVVVRWPQLDQVLWKKRIANEEVLAKSYHATQELPVKTIDDVLKSDVGNSEIKNSFKLVAKSLFQIFENNYGPLPLKAMSLKLNWRAMQDALVKAGETAKGNLQQYFKLSDFVFGFNDAHISVKLPSELAFRLPIQLRSSIGRVFIGAVTSEFPDGQRRPSPGDEVVGINGKTPQEFQKSFAVWNAVSNEETSLAYFALSFGNWRESRGIPLSILGSLAEENPSLAYLNDRGVVLSLRTESGQIYEVTLPFIKEGLGLIGRNIDEKGPRPKVVAGEMPAKPPKATIALQAMAPQTARIFDRFHNLFRSDMPNERASERGNEANEAKDGLMTLGQRKSSFALPNNFEEIKLPELFKKAQFKSYIDDDVLMAGTYAHNGKTVGFLRIASYSPKNILAAIPALRYMIAQLEAKSDYLVIDQMNNPGGYVLFSDMVIKALVGKYDTAKHLRFAVKPTAKFLREFAQMRDLILENEDKLFTDEEAKTFAAQLDADYRTVYEAYEAKRPLSEPVSMLMMSEYFERAFDQALIKETEGVEDRGLTRNIPKGALMSIFLKTNVLKSQTYTKPVYFMINELCFSGGDATPASLQDYGRVTLIGNRTAGAGGTVEEFELRGLFDMTINMTTSLMVRYKGNLVENYGVIPTISVPTLPTDIRSGGRTYFARIQKAIDEDLNNKDAGKK